MSRFYSDLLLVTEKKHGQALYLIQDPTKSPPQNYPVMKYFDTFSEESVVQNNMSKIEPSEKNGNNDYTL